MEQFVVMILICEFSFATLDVKIRARRIEANPEKSDLENYRGPD